VGNRGSRVQNIIHELHGEKIDIIPWSEDAVDFVRSAMQPAEISEILIDEQAHSMEIIVDDSQLALAIGKKGQNVRLAAKLTGWRIDIRSKSKADKISKKYREDLIAIPGIDTALADKLIDADCTSIDAVAAASAEDLAGMLGVDQDAAGEVKAQAQVLLSAGHEQAPEATDQ